MQPIIKKYKYLIALVALVTGIGGVSVYFLTKEDKSVVSYKPYTTSKVISKDGTPISYRTLGSGPGIVLVQGAMGSAQTFMEIAGLLSDDFTVYLPERRGRGESGPIGEGYTIKKEVEDLNALLRETGATNVFGLSSGGLIVLEALKSSPSIKKAIIFEPPLSVNGSVAMKDMPKFDQQLQSGEIGAALMTGMKIGEFGPGFMNILPNWLLTMLGNGIVSNEDKNGSGDYLPMRELAKALSYDFQLVREMAETADSFKNIDSEVLLLGGDQSPGYLKTALDKLEVTVPNIKRVEIKGIGHAASWNRDRGGQPEKVAPEIKKFFTIKEPK